MKNKDYNSINWHEIFTEKSESSTGLVWNIVRSFNIKVGDTAGCIRTDKKSGYKCFYVRYNNSGWLIHRILYVMRNGTIDAGLDIDHIDGNALNNSAENLRLVSTAVNMRNQKQRRTNSSGINGVSFRVKKGHTYAFAQWNNISGIRESKQFSCKKLGLLEAFAAACAYREKMIAELNFSGAGYSDRHGE